ncbi:MAG: DnaD domain protein [Streptococcus agalactiae]|nr:DnaD domain protein [Streptococcus agalactiae]
MVLKLDDYKDFEMFYKLPQELFDDCFKGLSLGAKVLYAILRDKWGQSQKNGWHDENGIYCNFSVKLLSELMGCSEKTVTSYKKELNNYQLISERRQFNSTNKIYVNRVSEAKSIVQEKITCTERKNLQHVQEKITCTERKNLPTNQTNINQTNLTRTCYPDGAGANYIDSIEDASAENDLGIVHDWIFSEFGRYPTPFEIEDLKYFLQDHRKEVIKLAIKECVGNGKPYFKYLESILRDWKQKGLTTVELVENRQKPKRSFGNQDRPLRLSDDGFDPRLGF